MEIYKSITSRYVSILEYVEEQNFKIQKTYDEKINKSKKNIQSSLIDEYKQLISELNRTIEI